jgi:hypothetical protein
MDETSLFQARDVPVREQFTQRGISALMALFSTLTIRIKNGFRPARLG